MLVLFHAICFTLTELSTPVLSSPCSRNFARSFDKISVIKSCYFSISSLRFTSPASLGAQKLTVR